MSVKPEISEILDILLLISWCHIGNVIEEEEMCSQQEHSNVVRHFPD